MDKLGNAARACDGVALYDGTDKRNRQYALPYAHTRVALRLHLRSALRPARRCYRTAASFPFFWNAEPVPRGSRYERGAYGLRLFLRTTLPPASEKEVERLRGARLRAVWGTVRAMLYGVFGAKFSLAIFLAGAFTKAIPGIILQLILIPVLVFTRERAFPQLKEKGDRYGK